MNPEQALQIIEQVRNRVQLSGQEHDAMRQAVQVLAGVVQQCEQLKAQVVDLTAKAAKVEKAK